LGIIPARGGSKGIPRKNVRLLAGQPLIHYACQTARQTRLLTRTLVSTDCPEIAAVARAQGVGVPFLRPPELATDRTPMIAVIRHALQWIAQHETELPEIVVLLQPTAPLRRSAHVDEAVQMLLGADYDAVVSVAPVPLHYNPHWQFTVSDRRLEVFTGEPLADLVSRRQDLPPTYTRNGAIYAFRRAAFEQTGSIYGRCCGAYVMPPELSVNLDSLDDWNLAEAYLSPSKAAYVAA
jgi:CMP-N-acetylneuraminic acid synthetase